jgi:outer membrane protein assembly factor BamB
VAPESAQRAPCRGGEFFTVLCCSAYGITLGSDGFIYVFLKTGSFGHIAKFKFDNGEVSGYQVVVWGLSRGVHQIDSFENYLFVVDTYNNRILRISNYTNVINCHWNFVSKQFFPNGELKNGRKSKNYNHFNSIYHYGGKVHLMAHNETYKTGRCSELYKVDSDFKIISIVNLGVSNCHNYYRDRQEEIFCASLEGEVVRNYQQCLLSDAGFTRGLSVSADEYLIGGSSVQEIRTDRNQGSGSIYCLNRTTDRKLFTIRIPGAQIQEIRRLDVDDFSLSDVLTDLPGNPIAESLGGAEC